MLWLLRRLGTSLLLMWVVASIVFLALHVVPGDPAEVLLSTGGTSPDPYAVAELRTRLGLDLPLHVQYGAFLAGLARGDLGVSLVDDYPVAEEIMLRLPRTLELILAGSLIAVLVGLPAGTYAAVRHGSGFDRGAGATAAVLQSVPVFVLGTLLILLFAQTLRWMPAGGYVPASESLLRHLVLLLLPALAVGKGLAAVVYRMTRASVLDALSRDHVRTARAKGLTPRRVLARHVVRNALSPVATVLGLHMGALLGGTVLVEYVFNWPGLSTPLLRAVEARDYPMVVGIILTVSALFLLINLAMDFLYAALDPRILRS
ncbi:peptide/nickel transport system permease protein [Humitalea rosea]|uniref:Peptide/nickel transport system permease protein n=1 Tax=Humitalea rosea TaxID=990373 RepID=A0A2W7I9Q5_9PROT|nr:ABC transporter permease [Humitalea rosea]PZW43636.1 peptide/nickel transport system permease protein [Humitalea rosea]